MDELRTHMLLTNAIVNLEHLAQSVDTPTDLLLDVRGIMNRLYHVRRNLSPYFQEVQDADAARHTDAEPESEADSHTTPTGEET